MPALGMVDVATTREETTLGTGTTAGWLRRCVVRIGPMLCCASLLACDAWSGPTVVGPFAAVTRLEHGQVALVDVGRRRVVGLRGKAMRRQSYPALSLDSTTLYYAGYDSATAPGILVTALDVVRNRVLWTTSVNGPYQLPDGTGAVRFTIPPFWLTATPDTGELLLYPAYLDGAKGIARYRPGGNSLTGFLPIHLAAYHTAVLRGRSTFPRGSLVICGTRRVAARPRADALFILGPELRVIDSIPLPPAGFEPYEVVVTADERFAFVKAPPFLFKVDLASRQVVERATNNTFGSLSLSPADDLVLVTDAGVALDLPGSGTISLFSESLAFLGSIDLRPLSRGSTPITWDAAITADGTLGIVVAGTPSLTLGVGPREASLFVVDLIGKRAVSHIPLNEYGTGRVFMVR
ncbi:MAG: hypothetical protein ACT4OZ_15815 [Gemmatimonadota bacterium]